MSNLFDREPDITVTSQDLVASGDLVDLPRNFMQIYLDRPVCSLQVTHASKALWGRLSPDARAARVEMQFIASCAADTAEEGEPADLLATPSLRALGEQPVWFQRNDVGGWTAMFPSDH